MAQSSDRRGGDLIFPEALQPEECAAAALLIERCGDQAQALLDELSAQMQANAVRMSPVAYLRGLVARASSGHFVPEAGLRVRIARRRRNQEAVELQNREEEMQRLAAERESPEYQAKLTARRAEIRQWLDRSRLQTRGGDRS